MGRVVAASARPIAGSSRNGAKEKHKHRVVLESMTQAKKKMLHTVRVFS